MDAAAAAKPPLAIRWIVAGALLLICAVLAAALTGHAGLRAGTVETLLLIHIALAAYAWVLYSTGASLVLSLPVFCGLVWAWAARRTSMLGWELMAFSLLLAVAAWQQRWRQRRHLRLSQQLDDLQEERRAKDQTISLCAQTRDALAKKLSRYTQLQTIAEELGNLTDLAAIGQLAVERAFSLIGKSDVCLLFLVDPERQELSLFASKKREPGMTVRAKHGDQFDRYVLRTHRPLLVNDVRRDFRFTVAVSQEREITSVIACPLLIGQTPSGVLRLDAASPGVYTQDDLRFLDILLDLIATAVTNARLFAQTQQLALTDGLTGLLLRRPFLDRLTRELARASRSRDAVSLLMLDVDHFKAYNDTFGHTAGDRLLRAIAEVLRSVVPPGGFSARYGGEEFVVLLPKFSRTQAAETAERIRKAVGQQAAGAEKERRAASAPPARHGAIEGRAGASGAGGSVSIGVASSPDDAQTELELLRVADQRLYQAKKSGRNQVCAA